MAGPPTPVSACPLVYLEIRDGANAKAYNSSHPHSAFTLTIEGERSIGSEMGILVLLIHKGKQQVVSLRLSEIRGGPSYSAEVISINKETNRICVSVPKKPQALLAQFESRRDFSVAVCLLQKAGFFASEAIPASLLTAPPQPVSQTHDAMFDTRPRLSSITPPTLLPPNHFQGTGASPDFSFTTMLNAPSQHSPFSTVPTPYMEQTQRVQSIPMQNYLPGTQMRHTTPGTAQLNPYHMFLERDGTHSHIPRIGSPLRYSFNSSPPPTQSPIGRADMAMPLSVSTTGSHAQSLLVRGSPEVGSFESRSDVDTKSCNTRADLTKDLSPEPYRQQPLQDQDFRKQMPRPRQLPFDSSAKTAVPYKKPEAHIGIRSGLEKSSDSRKPRSSPSRSLRRDPTNSGKGQSTETAYNTTNKGLNQKNGRVLASEDTDDYSNVTSSFEDHPPSSKSVGTFASVKAKDDMYKDAECQTTIPKSPKVSTGSQKSPESRQETSGVELLPWVILSDYNTLKDLNQATTPLVEQFEEDVARGGDAALLAQFYSKQLWERRRDFWYAKFQVMVSGQ
ncbi:uncharacterized protein FFB20_03254 [Fusarium fujikuroi]|uniref:Uncharacterized protein n=1 Tax=Gibberella fujikuroi (strain CBS 195.34 / IMI 58289 / NRRL A-6831) TaxID=1279085 RepID=S0DSN4_GIBF5|nr:uncharacterized protein FFUJ_04362 [Fusarium fujikuroi IMI 58289]KLO85509.1 uncharacterized protein LW93_14121 [Fusarium fujikuroi]KLP02854.1 uncharacterized protein Y057_10291 [Fusarium fujikuroi]KLP23408.1 uncharacterized protein LW94_8745 [Fusarium fujikuroi]CCT64417.1 uncharacterized protein FFUJ_04362 [Fusarium fujikuroi IMI 58289]SCN68932.1 uncharacterized protein FFB20_03254 [Fusarium fujikuroi]